MVFDELCVLANGDIVCSCGDPAGLRVYGNVYTDRIADVYNGAMYSDIRRWQLASAADSYCPVIGTNCSGRVSRATPLDSTSGRRVRVLQIEPTSYCNLRCPGCPATVLPHEASYARDRQNVLPLATMLDVVEQLPHLEKLLFYNFGEPFLHPEAITFLAEVRRRRPDVVIHTSTNGTAFRPGAIDALAAGALVDRIVFSIDGARPESYSRYRVRGDLAVALRNMRQLVEARGRAGTERMEVHWQYILFRWNDSDSEIAEAQSLAADIGVPLKWVVTHTEGASERFTFGSASLAELMGERRAYDAMTCDLKLADLWRAGVPAARQSARFGCDVRMLEGPPGARRLVEVVLENTGTETWNRQQMTHRVGCRLLAATADVLADEIPPRRLPRLEPGQRHSMFLDVALPIESGSYALFFDLVEEWVCWFHERGSAPLVLPVSVGGARESPWDPTPYIEATFEMLAGRRPRPEDLASWTKRLSGGMSLESLFESFEADHAETCKRRRAEWLTTTRDLARWDRTLTGAPDKPPIVRAAHRGPRDDRGLRWSDSWSSFWSLSRWWLSR